MTKLKSFLVYPLAALCFVASSAHAEPYCQKGAQVEMRWTGEWQPRVVDGGPDEYGKCLLSGDGNPAQWVSRDRIRPVGGGVFSDPVAPPAPVVDAGPAIVAPDLAAPVEAPAEEAPAIDPATGKKAPVKLKDFGELQAGVYVCTDRDLSFGILDGRDYSALGGEGGRYFFNESTNILEMTTGHLRGHKFRRNTERTFRVVGDNTQDCEFKVGKDPRSRNW